MLNPLEASPQAVTDDRDNWDTQGLSDWWPYNASHQIATSQTHWHYITTHPHSVHTVTLITTFVTVFFCHVCTRTPSHTFMCNQKQPIIMHWWKCINYHPKCLNCYDTCSWGDSWGDNHTSLLSLFNNILAIKGSHIHGSVRQHVHEDY